MVQDMTPKNSEDAKSTTKAYRDFKRSARLITHVFQAKAETLISKIDENHAEEIKKRIASS